MKLCHFLKQSYAAQDAPINILVEADGIGFDMDTAMPCGLLITEIVSNALKYRLPDNREGTIRIVFKKVAEKKVLMEISDNGIGLPHGFEIEKSESLGMQLIIALTSQLDGKLKFSGENGTKFSVRLQNAGSMDSVETIAVVSVNGPEFQLAIELTGERNELSLHVILIFGVSNTVRKPISVL